MAECTAVKGFNNRRSNPEMRDNRIHSCRKPRHGAAAVELALLLPILLTILLGAADFAQVFGYSVVVANCARNGALYGSSSAEASTDTAGIQTAALQDAGIINATVASSTGSDSNGSYVTVTVSCNVTLYSSYLGLGNPFALSNTAVMRVLPG
jgi:Flp pilus assembly protein TadG